MSTQQLEKIKNTIHAIIPNLTNQEKDELRDWIDDELDNWTPEEEATWDATFSNPETISLLEKMAEQALADHEAGLTTPFEWEKED
jgi:hypothetical protein